MKQCPVCKTTYTDTTLLYCLADGSKLTEPDDEQPTVVDRWEPVPATVVGIGNAPAVKPSGIGPYIKVLIVLVGLLVVSAFIVAAGVLFYLASGDRASNNQKDRVVFVASPTPESTSTQADDDLERSEKELMEQIANLEKMIREQSESDDPDDIPLAAYSKTARVNSPNDGFLALRVYPNSQAGSRILQIPHGANIKVGMCLNTSRLGNRSGRWCQASYNGYSGWVFDAFIVY